MKALTTRQIGLLGKLTNEFAKIDGRSRLNAEGLILLGLALAKTDKTTDTVLYKISAAGTKALAKAAAAPAPEKKARGSKAKSAEATA